MGVLGRPGLTEELWSSNRTVSRPLRTSAACRAGAGRALTPVITRQALIPWPQSEEEADQHCPTGWPLAMCGCFNLSSLKLNGGRENTVAQWSDTCLICPRPWVYPALCQSSGKQQFSPLATQFTSQVLGSYEAGGLPAGCQMQNVTIIATEGPDIQPETEVQPHAQGHTDVKNRIKGRGWEGPALGLV